MWSSGSSSGGSTDEDGMGWGDIANWITNEYTDGLGHDDKMDLSHVISSWFAKRDVHRRSLSGSGGPTGPSGKVCKPINDGSYVPPAAGYVPPTASYVTGSFMYIEQKKIDGGKPKGDGIKV